MLRFGLFSKINKVNYNDHSIDEVITKIKSGDKRLKELFINDYRQFILAATIRASGKYIDPKNSDEYSIGLLAFNEAIDCYDQSKNCSFFTFAEQVIKRRIIDYIRKDQKNSHVYPFTFFENEQKENFEERHLQEDFSRHIENMETKEELLLFTQNLWEFGITIEDLVLYGPKHQDAVQSCIKIAKIIADHDDMYKKLSRKKNLPMTDLMKKVKVHQRTVERNRKFIIAVSLIMRSNLSVLKGYVNQTGEGGRGL